MQQQGKGTDGDLSGDVTGVVVAAGRATRFGGTIPKQFLELNGRPLVGHAIAALTGRPGVAGVVVVLSADDVGGPREATVRGLPGVIDVVAGGATRARSVAAGVARARTALVLVHDAARPLAGAALVGRVVEATRRHGAAVPVVAVPDTVKRVDANGSVSETLDRSVLRLAQTPQGARRDWLLTALRDADERGLEPTDEAAALEAVGRRVVVVDGDADNVKVTSAGDLERLRTMERGMELRVGTGFDIHRFADGRRLVLGGVTFPGERGLDGHSDADVVLHAAMDAVLGAAGLGDIGALFPPDDPSFAGADSAALAAEVARVSAAAGWEVVNLDLTLLAERPRIRPRADEMRAAVARAFGIPIDRVGLKATTLEGLGALGRGEGAACQATALVRRSP